MICETCIHVKECSEQRGQCTSFKTLKDIQDEIKSVHQSFKSAAVQFQADKGGAGQSERDRRQGVPHKGAGRPEKDRTAAEKKAGIN